MVSDEAIEKILKAGRIAGEIRKRVKEIVKPGISYVDLAGFVERKILEMGGKPAFPCNISWGNEAAHYTPFVDDKRFVPDKGVLKIDFGVHVDGFLSDTAISIDLSGENEDLVKAVEEALDNALEIIVPGIKVSVIGEIIEKTLKNYGVKPVRNLTGHNMERYRLHAGLSVPNISGGGGRIVSGMLIAIEPFATKGLGYVVNGDTTSIFSITRNPAKQRGLDPNSFKLLSKIYNERRELPFTERWYINDEGLSDPVIFRSLINKALKKRVVTGYPVLIEPTGLQVAQAEDTVLVLDKEVIVTTRRV